MYYFYNLQKSTWLINVYNFLNNSVSTYLLRKQAAAVEDGNRSEEGEGKKKEREDLEEDRRQNRDRGGGRKGDHISDTQMTSPAMQKKTIRF